MPSKLQVGDKVHDMRHTQHYTIEAITGVTHAGELYQITSNNTPTTLLWFSHRYLKEVDRGALTRLHYLLELPVPGDEFSWPLTALTNHANEIGVALPLKPPSLINLNHALKPQVAFPLAIRTMVGLHLVLALRKLAQSDIFYQDLEPNQLELDLDSGKILLGFPIGWLAYHTPKGTSAPLRGSPRFSAPEVLRQDALPSPHTQLYTLAVFLFYLFVTHHPLEGKRELTLNIADRTMQQSLYADDPLFIFDPDDNANHPVSGYHDNALHFWSLYPAFLREEFTRAFTVGLHNPSLRVTFDDWLTTLTTLRDSIFYCDHCHAENFYDSDILRRNDGQPAPCWKCSKTPRLPPRMRLGDAVIMLNHNTQLYPHHLNPDRPYDFSQPALVVRGNRRNQQGWWLQNVSGHPWTVVTPTSGEPAPLESGRQISLDNGLRLSFTSNEIYQAVIRI